QIHRGHEKARVERGVVGVLAAPHHRQRPLDSVGVGVVVEAEADELRNHRLTAVLTIVRARSGGMTVARPAGESSGAMGRRGLLRLMKRSPGRGSRHSDGSSALERKTGQKE